MSKAPKAIPKAKLSREAKRLITYWRDSLLEGEREDLSPQILRELSTRVTEADFVRGHCSPEAHRTLVQKLVELNKQREARRGGKVDESPSEIPIDQPLDVLICPLRFQARAHVHARARFLDILWLPATLLPTGVLQVPQKKLPWITRDVLEPSGDDECPVVGTLRAVEKFSERRSLPQLRNWADYLSYVDELVEAVAGRKRSLLKISGYDRRDDALVVPDRLARGSSRALLNVLEDVASGEVSASVLAAMAQIRPVKRSAYRHDKAIYASSAKRHVGHFTETFPLSRSQRLALHRCFEMGEGEFLSITGPPGTGKTTVLQSIIATAWTEAAIQKAQCPPVMVCTGATNQSVMNIIDCFGREASSAADSQLSQRWLPDITSYGTFCSSATKAEELELMEGRQYQLELKDGNGLSSLIENLDYVRKAEEFYLRQYEEAYGKRLSVGIAVEHLQRLLLAEHQKFTRSVTKMSGLGMWIFLASLFKKEASLSEEQFLAQLAEFDTTARHRMFVLATHYWEGRWLQSVREHLHLRRDREGRRLDVWREAWQRRAMVTPAFVATLSMLPRFFSFNRRNPTPPIDWLIFDEAGQIPVEQGTASLPLTKRAVVVGDCLQLEPYWVVQPHIDRSNLQSNGVADPSDKATWNLLVDSGTLASGGSLMKRALASEAKSDGDIPGVLLSEQRRSVPELVEFSNRLAYQNRLEAKRSALGKRLLPTFGYVHIPGKSEQSGSSRLNRMEARELINWLLEWEARIKKFYSSEDICELVAIITPFAAQHRELRRKLPERFAHMIVGTVGGLQGAERPIVIFSTVYDDTFNDRYFFDQSPNMLNVAVSRARDSFIVFGDMAVYSEKANTPSGELARFLFSDEDKNELPPAFRAEAPRVVSKIQRETSRRLSTLEEHRTALRDAFLGAKHEVFLVSPSISSPAVLADRLSDLIQDAVSRGVQVTVVTDYDLNRQDGDFKPRALEGFELLQSAGAVLHIVGRIHNKSLAVDGELMIEGSFNWLSANRNPTSRHQKHETSWVHSGPEAVREIKRLKDEMVYRLKGVDDLLEEKAENQ